MRCIVDKLVYPSEDLINLPVPAPIVPPSLNDSIVIAVDEKVGVAVTLWDEDPNEAFEANGLSPSDVSCSIACCLPSRDEAPCSPPVANGDGDANARARVRERPNIDECNWYGDGAAEIGLEEDTGPPAEVPGEECWGRYWAERIRTEERQHGLQFGDESAASWNDRAGV